jgi:copper chaperone CopZ
VKGVLSVRADMNAHSVTVEMEDPSVSAAVVKALADAGYTSGEPKAAPPEGETP